jgi:L-alanine-DL-glutamate epimerase-like enolase superfamily enzyme
VKITDVTVKRYSASREPRADAAGIQIVEVHTDAGVTGMGFVSAGSASSDIVAMLVRRNLKAVLLGEDPLLTGDLWRRMHDQAVPRRGGEGIVRTCMAAVDFALWDLKGKLLNVPVSALLGGRRPRVATYANCAHHLPPDKLAEKAAGYVKQGHTALKIRGSATYVSLREATERVKHVREAIGPDVKLMVDVNGTWDVEYFMADNPLLEFQSRLFRGPVLREEATEDGIFLVPPDTPGLGLALDEAVAAAALVPE